MFECSNGIHYFYDPSPEAPCRCLAYSQKEHLFLQARQKIKSGARKLWKHAKLDWAKEKMGVPVIQKDLEGNEIAVFSSCMDAEYITGVSHRNLSQVTLGRRNHAGGFKWEKA